MYYNKPFNLCACGKEKRVMSKYCVKCGAEINRLRVLIRTWCKANADNATIKLKELLVFHHNEPIKTKTTKMREKRAWLSH